MTDIKSYTDIKQSKKLAEILPLESADMYYILMSDGAYNHFPLTGRKTELAEDTDIPCWSLAALLGVIPKRIKDFNVLRIDINEKDFSIWYDEIGSGVNTELPDITTDNPVDACYEMIIHLHKLNLL